MTEQGFTEENQERVEEPKINEQQLNLLMSQMQSEQNLPMAVLGGLVAALAGAIIWAIITAATDYQIGWMAVGVGFLVGFSVRFTGKGVDKIYGVIGAVFALLGCLAGNFFTVVYFVSVQESISFFDLLLGVDFNMIVNIMTDTFQVMDILFYGIAIYEGYRFSIKQITEQELAQITKV